MTRTAESDLESARSALKYQLKRVAELEQEVSDLKQQVRSLEAEATAWKSGMPEGPKGDAVEDAYQLLEKLRSQSFDHLNTPEYTLLTPEGHPIPKPKG